LVDLNKSYDLQSLPLSFSCKAVYPGQKNISIQKISTGVYKITVQYDPAMPRTRFPVILSAHNGQFFGNPVFVNFYWPQKDQKENPAYCWRTPFKYDPLKKWPTEVIDNKRPVISTGLADNQIFCQPGEEISFKVQTADPEGFPVILYRWFSDVGTLQDSVFSYTIPDDAGGKIIAVHFIASDGTGGYGSVRIKMIVKAKDILPEGWKSTVVGMPEAAGSVRIKENTVSLTGSGRIGAGVLVYRKFTDPFDKTIDVSKFINDTKAENKRSTASIGFLNNLEERPQAFLIEITKQGTKPVKLRCFREIPFRRGNYFSNEDTKDGHFLRLLRSGNDYAGYYSSDNKNWQMLWTSDLYLDEAPVFGLKLNNGDGKQDGKFQLSSSEFTLLSGSSPALPIIKVNYLSGNRDGSLTLRRKSDVTMLSIGEAEIYYSLDGSEPTKNSLKFTKKFQIEKGNEYHIKAKAFYGDVASGTVELKIKK